MFVAAFTPCSIEIVNFIQAYHDALIIILDFFSPDTMAESNLCDRLKQFQSPPAKKICEVLKDRVIPYLEEKKIKIPSGFKLLVDEVCDVICKELSTKALKGRHALSRLHRDRAREVAKRLWSEGESITLTLEQMILCDEVQAQFDGKVWRDDTVRKWIKDLNPNTKPGRRPVKQK